MKYLDPTLKKMHDVLITDYESAKSNIIFPTDQGYEVFDIYKINLDNNKVLVYKFKNYIGQFTSTRTALSWCIADKYNHIRLADEIQKLDESLHRLRNDVITSQIIVKKMKNPNNREIAHLKLQKKLNLVKEYEFSMDKCVTSAKYWQTRGFHDEIERARRTTPNKENRQGIRVLPR
jgi:hypothetical protein